MSSGERFGKQRLVERQAERKRAARFHEVLSVPSVGEARTVLSAHRLMQLRAQGAEEAPRGKGSEGRLDSHHGSERRPMPRHDERSPFQAPSFTDAYRDVWIGPLQ